MKRVSIFCVNYNSYDVLDNYIASLDIAAGLCQDMSVDVFIIDNTDKDYKDISYNKSNINIKVHAYHENLGYFGGICRAIRENNLDAYDYFVISNVDVLVDKSFFKNLSVAEYKDNIGIIAPQIYSINEKKNRNPGRITRYTRRELKTWLFLYSHPFIYSLYYKYVYLLRKPTEQQLVPKREIYLAHGSFIILTKEFYNRCGLIDYPIFLYGEEIYLAELSLKHNLKTVYDPSLKVTDIDHVSTGKLKFSRYCKYCHDAIKYILDNVMK